MPQENPVEETEPRVQINCLLDGPDAVQFLKYKDRFFFRSNSEAARTLMLQRLADLDAQQKEVA